MKKMVSRFLAIFIFGVLFPLALTLPARAEPRTQTFLDAVKHYEARKYAEAAEGFTKLANEGVRNGKLYYDIANAHLKQGRLGLAILWYERALRLIPDDPDLKFNLNYARTLVKDEPAALGSPLLQVLFFWKDLLRVSEWQGVGIMACVLFWCFCAAAYYFKKSALKPFIYGLLCLALLSSGTAIYLRYASVLHPRAVILGKAVPIRSGFSSDTTALFVLHEGTLVAVEKQTGGFLKIRYAKDKIGWVSNTLAETI